CIYQPVRALSVVRVPRKSPSSSFFRGLYVPRAGWIPSCSRAQWPDSRAEELGGVRSDVWLASPRMAPTSPHEESTVRGGTSGTHGDRPLNERAARTAPDWSL